MSKETLKKKSNSGDASILDLANALRSKSPVINDEKSLTEDNEGVSDEIVLNETVAPEKIVSNADVTGISELLKKLKETEYSCKSVIYIDDEIKEVFNLLKIKHKISTSTLASYILESWLDDNKDIIKSITEKSKNRFF